MSGMQLNTDFSQIRPNEPGGQQFPVTTDKLGHLVKIVDSAPRENSKKTGMLCVLKLEVIDGPHKGLIGEQTYNITNPNQQAADIGMSELSAIAHVIGVLRVGNTAEMHQKPFRILVRQQKEPNQQYTEIYGYLDQNGNPPGKAGQGPQSAQPAQGGGGWGGQGGQPQGGFSPGPGQPQNGGQGGGQNWQPNGQQGNQQQNWQGGQQQNNQTDPNANQQQNNGGQPGWGQNGGQNGGGNNWQGGGGQNNGQPGWAGGGNG